MNRQTSNHIAIIAIFFATMLTLHALSSVILNPLPLPIKPTLIHIPVIIASILYGPRIGATLGGLMGLISMIHNTLFFVPTSSYLFSPFVENGSIYSIIIALFPRILIGISPYFVYKWFRNRPGLILAGAIGSLTNTIFVLGGIFFLFQGVFSGNLQALIATVLGTNSIAEMIIAATLTAAMIPTLQKVTK